MEVVIKRTLTDFCLCVKVDGKWYFQCWARTYQLAQFIYKRITEDQTITRIYPMNHESIIKTGINRYFRDDLNENI